ncbi:MAG: hypothetical protein K5796_10955 [Lachnospiraceae bacterium]|nr:hypothetical protein [Lachnospiraceae bacterium]
MGKRKIYLFASLIMIISGIIWTFTNLAPDEGYQIAMAYRISQGDSLLTEMLEPHQFSALLTGFLVYLYQAIFGTYTGVVVYLHLAGILIRAGLAAVLYMILKKETEKPLAYGAAVLFFMITPKDFAMPEYGNQQAWYGLLCFVFLMMYFRSKKLRFLVPAAISLCLLVLAYPSGILSYAVIVVLLILYGEKSQLKKEIALFTGVCALIGGGLVLYLVGKNGLQEIGDSLRMMTAIEPSHTVGVGSRLLRYGRNIAELLAVYAIVTVASLLITSAVLAVLKKKKSYGKEFRQALFLAIFGIILLIGFFLNILLMTDRCAYTVIFIYMTSVGLFYSKKLSGEVKRLYVVGTILGISCVVSTLILTDLPFVVSGAYGVLAIALSVIPLQKMSVDLESSPIRKTYFVMFAAFVCLLFARCVYIRTPLTGRSQICTILNEDMSYVHNGPAKWIITNNEGAMIQQVSYEEFRENIPMGSKVWLVDSIEDSLGYMYGGYEVAIPSVMSDPKYQYEAYYDVLKEYWEKHPDKYPDVVAVKAYKGDISYDILASGLLMDFIEKEYKPVRSVDGTYWKLYFRE